MKKFSLFLIMCGMVFVSVTANAKDYKKEDVVTCPKNKKLECDLKGNPITGEVTYYGSDGRLWSKASFKNGKKEGVSTKYYENGNVSSMTTFKDGKIEGPWKWYYENGQLRQEATFKNGKIEGPNKKYDEKGQLISAK